MGLEHTVLNAALHIYQLPIWLCRKPRGTLIWYGERVQKTRPALFRRRHFEDHVIVLCVRWYLRYCLTLRDVEEMMSERGLTVDHSTIGRWVLRYAPELHKRLRRELRPPNRSWRVDETYIRVAGAWTYLYRAVDSTGATIDFMLSPKRDVVAAKHFLQMALWHAGQIRPRVLNVERPRFLPARHRRIEGDWRTGPPLPVPTLPLLEQCTGARSSLRQEARRRQPVVPFCGRRVADHRRI